MSRTTAIAEPGASINASIMTAAPHTKSAIHHHGPQDTIIYALKGAGGTVVTDNGKTTTRLRPGDFCLIPAGVEHMEANEGDDEAVWVITRSGEAAQVVNVDGWQGN